MSLIKKIADLTDRNDSIDAKKHVAKLSKEVQGYKEKVRGLIEANYVDFVPGVVSNEELLNECGTLQNETKSTHENLKNELNSMHSANDQISKLVENLEETQMALRVALKLVKVDAIIQRIKLLKESHRYKDIHKQLNSLEGILKDPEDTIIRRLDCIKSLTFKLVAERSSLTLNLENEFNRLVQLKEKNFQKTCAITCIISKNTEAIVDCIYALIECGFKFNSFVEFIMNNVFEPTTGRAVSLDIKENDRDYIMILSYSTEKVTEDIRPTYPIVFQNLEEIIKFLLNMNISDSEGHHFLAKTFKNEKLKIMDMLFTNCLKHCIPKTFEEKTQCSMKEDIRKLCETFMELNFSFSDSTEEELIQEIYDKIDDHFHQQFTHNVQASASELLKRDLHDMILISDDATFTTSTPLTFPKGMISKSTLELIKLLERILRQAKECEGTDEMKKTNLLDTIKNVLENYTFTIQLHHAQLLTKIPQQSALFYNNCHYLSNWILTNKEFIQGEIVVNDLKRQGEEFFDCQVAKQKIQLSDILKDFDLSLCLNNILPEHFKPIRQCLRQMDLLKNVWQTILPSELYNDTMGRLIDSISLDMIKKVTNLEDISTTLSNSLVELIKTVDEKCQALFEADVSVFNVSPSWEKLVNLQFILDASLVDIQGAWKSERLSKNFKADEVKRLIRALFQNTERRANCLQTIV